MRAPLGEQKARVGLTSTLVFCDRDSVRSLKEVHGSRCFGVPGFASDPSILESFLKP